MRPLKQAIYSSRTADKFVVRLPDGMRERINEVAKNHHRSMNSEIIARLEASLKVEEALELAEELGVEIEEPIEPWNPVEGMLVTFRKGEHKGKALLLKKLTFDKGVIMASITNSEGPGLNPISDLMPFLVK